MSGKEKPMVAVGVLTKTTILVSLPRSRVGNVLPAAVRRVFFEYKVIIFDQKMSLKFV